MEDFPRELRLLEEVLKTSKGNEISKDLWKS